MYGMHVFKGEQGRLQKLKLAFALSVVVAVKIKETWW